MTRFQTSGRRFGAPLLAIATASSFLQRLRGLMFARALAPERALLLTGCASVHTAFMRFAIDVLYLDDGGAIVKCVPDLQPWRASAGNIGRAGAGQRQRRAIHTLELAAGTIARLGMRCGDRVEHAALGGARTVRSRRGAGRHQGGVALIEMAVVAPLLTVMGLSLVQYGMMFFAKNQINHASFMAARAGSVANASLASARSAYEAALVPMYGGGQSMAELAATLVKVKADVAANTRIEMLNPTKESFQDWNDSTLQTSLQLGSKRVISNHNLAFKNLTVGAASGQTLQDANLIKLRITHGYKPVVPIIASIYKAYLKYFDPRTDAFHTQLVQAGRIPITTDVTVQMQSDAIEPDSPVSSPGPGNEGNPTDPGDPPGLPQDPGPPPDCRLGGCETPTPPGTGGTCQAPISSSVSADTLFAFDSATISAAGKLQLDSLVQRVRDLNMQVDTLKVTGYTDPLGGDAYNQALSQSRAQAVLDYLHQAGLQAANVVVEGKGSADLIKTLNDCPASLGVDAQKACLAPNRRVVIDITPR